MNASCEVFCLPQPIFCNILTEESQVQLSHIAAKMNKALSEDSLISGFTELEKLKVKLNSEMRQYYLALSNPSKFSIDTCKKEIEKIIPFVDLTWTEEGTIPFLTLNNEALIKKAATTKGKSDDYLFALLRDIWGAAGEYMISFPVWMHKTTDLSGYSTLGDGNYIMILQKLAMLKKEKKPFIKAHYEKNYGILVDNLTSVNTFGNSREKVIEEIQKLLNSKNLLTPTDHKRLLARKQELLEKNSFQFNCRTQKCKFE